MPKSCDCWDADSVDLFHSTVAEVVPKLCLKCMIRLNMSLCVSIWSLAWNESCRWRHYADGAQGQQNIKDICCSSQAAIFMAFRVRRFVNCHRAWNLTLDFMAKVSDGLNDLLMQTFVFGNLMRWSNKLRKLMQSTYPTHEMRGNDLIETDFILNSKTCFRTH